MACFPGLGPSVQHTPHANRSIAGSPLDRTPGKSPMLSSTVSGPSPLNEATPQSKAPPSGLLRSDPAWGTDPDRASSFGRTEAPPEWVYTGVYLLLAVPRFRFTYLSLDLLSRSPPHLRPFQVLPRTARCC